MGGPKKVSDNSLKIDVHNHYIPADIPDFKNQFGYGGFIQLDHSKDKSEMVYDDGTFFRAIEKNCFSVDHRIEDLDRMGISVQVLSTIPVMFSYWSKPRDCQQVCRFFNEDIAKQVRDYSKRFLGIGSLPMTDVNLACEELNYLMKDLNLCGVQIGSHIGDLNLDDPIFFPLYEEMEKLGASLLIHPWDMMGKETMSRYWLPWLVGMPAEGSRAICSMIFGGIFEKFPKLKVMFAHAGGSFLGTLGRIDHAYHSRPDLCAINISRAPSTFLKDIYIDSITHDEEALMFAIKKMGADRIALGSDYPFPLGEHWPGKMISSSNILTENEKESLLHKTALDWLNISEERFL